MIDPEPAASPQDQSSSPDQASTPPIVPNPPVQAPIESKASGQTIYDKPEAHKVKTDNFQQQCCQSQNEDLNRPMSMAEKIRLRIETGLGVLMLIVVSIQCFIMIQQNKIMETQNGIMNQQIADARTGGKETDEILKSQSIALQKTADATFESVAVALSATRPWVGFTGEPSATPSQKEGTTTLSLTVENSGKSPAKILTFQVGAHVELASNPFSPRYDLNNKDLTFGSRTLLLPGRSATAILEYESLDGRLSLLEIRDTNFNFYVYGDIRYEDITSGKRHLTRACFYRPGLYEKTYKTKKYFACPEYAYAD